MSQFLPRVLRMGPDGVVLIPKGCLWTRSATLLCQYRMAPALTSFDSLSYHCDSQGWEN